MLTERTSVRIGIDLVEVREVQESLEEHGERYLRRIYTAQERRDSRDEPRHLAARFAAKEATIKALGYGDEAIDWLTIDVGCGRHGEPTLDLTDRAAALAAQRGLLRAAVSLVHERSHALAVVLLTVAAPDR